MTDKMVGYMFLMAIAFLLMAKKPKDFGDFAGKMIGWWCSPLILVLCLIVGYFDRKKLRWLSHRWFEMSVYIFFCWCIYGMTETYYIKYFKYKKNNIKK